MGRTPQQTATIIIRMAASNAQSTAVKPYFKAPEGRYKLSYEKTHPAGLLHYSHGKAVTQVTLAQLKDKPVAPPPASSSFGSTSSVRNAAARLLGGVNGTRMLGFGGSNGTSKPSTGNKVLASPAAAAVTAHSPTVASHSPSVVSSYDGEGTYIIFNVGDTLFISDYNSRDKDPIKAIHFSSSNPICHAFDSDAKDDHDLLIGLNSGDVYSVSLRQQLQDPGKKLVGAHHYNKDGSLNSSRCTAIAWVPGGDGFFLAAHADGNLYFYHKNKDGTIDATLPIIKDQTQFSVTHAKSSKSNPIARWHVCQCPINSISFSADGQFLATVGRDGHLRIFDFAKEQLICGGKSYYGALLCCAWSPDGKYVLAGGEDDLVQVWSMEDRAVVAWGEGHNSWVSAVVFDSCWTLPCSDGAEESTMYRFGSVGQDTQLLLWDLVMDEIVVPVRRCAPGGSPTYSTSSQSSCVDNVNSVGLLQSAPSRRDVPKLSPVVAHRVHAEPLSGLIFAKDSIITCSHEGHLKIWTRPCRTNSPAGNSDVPHESLNNNE